jgi:hypothetical protein
MGYNIIFKNAILVRGWRKFIVITQRETVRKTVTLLGSERNGLAEMGSGLYRRGQAMGEGESLWSLIICDHQMEQVDMPG